MHTWSSIAANEIITRAELDAAITASIFTRKITFPADDKCVTKAQAASYIYLDASNTFYSPKASNQLIAKRDLTACNSTANFVTQNYTTCVSCVDYTVYKDINVCSSTYNHYRVNGVDVGTAQPTGILCSFSANYSLAIGYMCISCTTYTVYQNTNNCFTGNQYYANGVSYGVNPSSGACNTTTPVFPYGQNIGIYCDKPYCNNIPVSQNSNSCYTGPNQYTIGNDIYFSTNPVTGNCSTSPEWTINAGTICVGCGNYFVYQNSNNCYTGNQYFTYATGFTYATNPATGSCFTDATYTLNVGRLCISCQSYIVYQNTNPCFGGNQYFSNGVSYSYNPSTGYCNESANYSNPIGQICVGCTTYTVYQNSNPCFQGNQYYYNGNSYSTNPSTTACNTSANYGLDGTGYIGVTCDDNCQPQNVYINLNNCYQGDLIYYWGGSPRTSVPYGMGGCDNNPNYTFQNYYTCYQCQNLKVYRDTARCNVTAGKWFVYTDQWVQLSGAPVNYSCDYTPNYESQGYVTCISCVDYLVYKDTRECSPTKNHYFRYNGSSYDDLGTSAPTSGYCACCTEYAITNYNTSFPEYVEWTDCANNTHTTYLYYPDTLYVCVKTGTYFTYGSANLVTLGSCNY